MPPSQSLKHSHVTREVRDAGRGCPACDSYHIGKAKNFMGMSAVLVAVDGTMLTYELGTEKVRVSIDVSPRGKVSRTRSTG